MVLCSRCGRYSGSSYMCGDCLYTTSLNAKGQPQKLAVVTSEDRFYAQRFKHTYGRMPASTYELGSYMKDQKVSNDRDQ